MAKNRDSSLSLSIVMIRGFLLALFTLVMGKIYRRGPAKGSSSTALRGPHFRWKDSGPARAVWIQRISVTLS